MPIPKKLKEAFANDPEIMEILNEKEQAELADSMGKGEGEEKMDFFSKLAASMVGEPGKTPIKGEDYMTPEELQSLKEEILKEATPEKFKDYFTDEELTYIMGEIKTALKDEVTPQKGVHYFDGEDGKDAEVDVDGIVQAVLDKMPHDEENELPPEEVKKRLADLEASIPKVDTIVSEIKKGKLLELRDIKGARLDTPKFNGNDQRWHGGGPQLNTTNAWTAPQRTVIQTLTSSGGIATVDFSLCNNYTITLTENTEFQVLNLPTDSEQSGVITIIGGGSSYDVTFSTDWKAPSAALAATFTVPAAQIDEVVYLTKVTYVSGTYRADIS